MIFEPKDIKLRKHQAEMLEICKRIRCGESIRNIYALVTPGGGKSALPVIAGSILIPNIADAICWIAPRTSLQKQGEINFMDPLFRRLCSHSLTIRSSTNDADPCRGENGFITTYQALGVDRGTVVNEFRRKRYILILDEYHHAEEDSKWHGALNELVNLAVVRVFMTGTIERGNGKKIAFTPYRDVSASPTETVSMPSMESDPQNAVIRYSRMDALKEGAILPIKFELFDGNVKWKNPTGPVESHNLSTVNKKSKVSAAIYTALNTQFAKDLLGIGFEHWIRHKASHPTSRLLVVTSGIDQAREAVKYLKGRWALADIATSHESAAAHKAIDNFRAGSIDVLVSIAIAYEGLDVKQISHIIVITNIRSSPWLEQCLARAVRVDPDAGPDQMAYVFAPDDILFREVCAKIEAEQTPYVRTRKQTQANLFGEDAGQGPSDRIKPIDGRITQSRGFEIGSYERVKTPSEIEADLRDAIEFHVRTYARRNYYMPQKINAEIRAKMGKPRSEMNRDELAWCLEHVRNTYPMQGRSGSGSPPRKHKRLFPTKPVKWAGA